MVHFSKYVIKIVLPLELILSNKLMHILYSAGAAFGHGCYFAEDPASMCLHFQRILGCLALASLCLSAQMHDPQCYANILMDVS